MKVGNFVEVKNTILAPKTKANHLAYIGDAKLGTNTNIGAGTIFCNYDGINKHRTVVGDNVFIDLTFLIAFKNWRWINSGSRAVINIDVPSDSLAIARPTQLNKIGLGKKIMLKLHKVSGRVKLLKINFINY